jgi:hypothetical protein
MARDISLGNPVIDPKDDKFNRWPFSRALADRVADLGNDEGAAVVGLYGKWGYGKSSVLNFIKYRIEQQHSNKVVLFEFNPWLFKNQEALLANFYLQLQEKMNEATGQKLGKMLADYSGLLGMVPGIGAGLKTLAEQISNQITNLKSQQNSIRAIMAKASRTVVVLIDDLDRLDREEIMTMLKLVRLAADLPHVVYLLAFDDEMVAKAAGSFYNNNPDAGRQFLEKIVQFPFTIPAVGHQRLVNYVVQHAHDAAHNAAISLSDADWANFRELTDHCLSQRLTTPRQAIRYGSALTFALPILKEEVDPLEQMVVEGLRVLFPEVYAHVRDNSGFFIRPSREWEFSFSEEELAEQVKSVVPMESKGDFEAATRLLQFLFRNTRKTSQPITDPRYFSRHFGYALLPAEIYDTEISSLLLYAEASNEEELTKLIEVLAQRNPVELVTLLRRQLRMMSEQQLVKVTHALIPCGYHFVTSETADNFTMMLAELIGRIHLASFDYVDGDSQRCQLAAEIVSQIEPLPLASVFMNALGRLDLQRKQDDERNRITFVPIISGEGWDSLRKAFVTRVRAFANVNPTALFDKGFDDSDLFAAWYIHGVKDLREWFELQLEKDPSLSILLLRRIMPDSSDDAARVNFSFVTEAVSPAVLKKSLLLYLRETERSSPDTAKRSSDVARSFLDERSSDIRFARSFLNELNERLRANSSSESTKEPETTPPDSISSRE